ncbi:MAG TPA: TIR domain-containing protein [Pseudolabrys sp.]|nr:TIR domain-containing protein [Pseudolabrys sp.]
MTGKIFINYRRGDDAGNTGRVCDRLRESFGSQQLFLDVDNIAPGLDYTQVLNQRVSECDVMLSIIGKGWIDARDASGMRRLDKPDDPVRLEITSALSQSKRVIPILVGGAQMPERDELPEAIKALATRNAVRLTHERFGPDIQGLIKSLRKVFDETDATSQRRIHYKVPKQNFKWPTTILVSALSVALVVAAVLFWRPSPPSTVQKPFTPIPFRGEGISFNPENEKYLVLVFYRPDRIEDAQRIVGALRQAGYRSDGSQSTLEEVIAPDKRSGTSLIKTSTLARPVASDVSKIVRFAIPIQATFVSMFPDDVPLQRGNIQIDLF